jgi:hypothetical protein
VGDECGIFRIIPDVSYLIPTKLAQITVDSRSHLRVQMYIRKGGVTMPSEDGGQSVLQTDVHALDLEFVRQPELYRRYAAKLADAKFQLDEAKSAQDVSEAEVSLDIRSNPARYGIEKVTEDGIKIRVLLHARVRESVAAVNTARHKVGMLEAMVRALEHRKTTLENLVVLKTQDYYAEPKVPVVAGDSARRSMEESTRRQVFGKAAKPKEKGR